MASLSAADVMSRLSFLARELDRPVDPISCRRRIVELAPKLLNCSVCDIVAVHRSGRKAHGTGGVVLDASSDDALSVISLEILTRSGEGHRLANSLLAPGGNLVDLTELRAGSDPNPMYARQMISRTGIRAELVMPLAEVAGFHLLIRFLYRELPESAGLELAPSFVDSASLAVAHSELLRSVETLQAALISNRQIGIATGILMAQLGVTAEDAFARLKASSQNHNQKLRTTADHIVRTGEFPTRGRTTHQAVRAGKPC
ncbi:ANTAR domain-containing protein [Nakamurella silvestris]|nr:ANTAR domain-containing protein [Nakamurella silvestris]